MPQRANATFAVQTLFYVIQKFFEYGSTDQRSYLAGEIKGNVYQLAMQMYK